MFFEGQIVRNQVPDAVHVWLVMTKAVHAIAQVASASFQGSELGESDFRVLEVLLHKGPLPVNTIGPKVQLTPGSISVAVDRLYTRKLVSREENPNDRRVRTVALTPKGRTLISTIFREHARRLELAFSMLSPEEKGQLESLLKKVGKHAEQLTEKISRTGLTAPPVARRKMIP